MRFKSKAPTTTRTLGHVMAMLSTLMLEQEFFDKCHGDINIRVTHMGLGKSLDLPGVVITVTDANGEQIARSESIR